MANDETGNAQTARAAGQKLKTYLMLHGILFLYSLGAVCSKMASGYPFLSVGYIGWYAGLLAVLVVYVQFGSRCYVACPLSRRLRTRP